MKRRYLSAILSVAVLLSAGGYIRVHASGDLAGAAPSLLSRNLHVGATERVVSLITLGGLWPASLTESSSDFIASEAAWTTSSVPGPISAIVVDHNDPESLFVVNFGIYHSGDGGFTWTARNDGLPELPTWGVMVMHPTNSDILYTLADSEVYRTLNGAQTWHPLNTPDGTKVGLAVCPASPDSLYMWSRSRIYYTEDLGESWEVIREPVSGQSFLEVAVDPQSPNTVYYGTYVGGVFKTSDGGATWEQVLPNYGEIVEISIDSTDSQIVYVMTLERPAPFYGGTHVYRSNNGGHDWSTVDSGLPIYPNGDLFKVIHIVTDPSSEDVFAQVEDQGIWHGTKTGDSWSPTGLPQYNMVTQRCHHPAEQTFASCNYWEVAMELEELEMLLQEDEYLR